MRSNPITKATRARRLCARCKAAILSPARRCWSRDMRRFVGARRSLRQPTPPSSSRSSQPWHGKRLQSILPPRQFQKPFATSTTSASTAPAQPTDKSSPLAVRPVGPFILAEHGFRFIGLHLQRHPFGERPSMNPRKTLRPRVVIRLLVCWVLQRFLERNKRVTALAKHVK